MSDKIASALIPEFEHICGEKGYLKESEATLARMAMNIIAAALENTQPATALQVQASGSMSESAQPDGSNMKRSHSLEIKITPFYTWVG